MVLTGGEPLLQVDQALINALHARGFAVAVETNGTIIPPDGMDWICVAQGRRGTRAQARARTEAGLSAGRRAAGKFHRPRLPSASRCSRWTGLKWREYRARHRLLPAPSEVAAQPADPQDARYQVEQTQWTYP